MREKMVTRTISTTKAVVSVYDTLNETIDPVTIIMSGKHDVASVLKFARKKLEGDTLRVLKVVESYSEEKLYGMTEAEFIASAQEMEPRKAKETTKE